MIDRRAVILTALSVEYKAVRAHLEDLTESVHKEGTVYEIGLFTAGTERWEVCIAEIGAGNPTAAGEAERAINYFEPEVALFIGVAGGVKDVQLGDVVAASKIYGYESGKQEREFKPRPEVRMSSYSLVQRARAEAKKENWKHRIIGVRNSSYPRALIGALAAGQKVIANKRSDLFEFLKTNYNDVLAVEMEGEGFLSAVDANERVKALIIRAISDQIDNKSDIDDAIRQDNAARHASAFAFEILANLQGPDDAARPTKATERATRELVSSSAYTATPPAVPEIFLGRDDDLTELKRRLRILGPQSDSASVQVLTALRGWPGIGKTAMATVLAHDKDIERAFPDGVLWTSLGQSPSVLIELGNWGRALGTDEILKAATIREATSLLSARLSGKRLLLIVDDVWEVAHVIPFRQLQVSNSALLITTRQPGVVDGLSLNSDSVYNLPALTEERAVELLEVLAPSVVAMHRSECAELAEAVECLPLALHVAGRLLAAEARMDWGVVELLEELREGATLIEAKAPADMMDYESQTIPTVAALLRKSTDRLDQSTREYFAMLAPFAPKPATFNLESLQAIWELDDPKPIARTLVEHGLIEPVGGRFQMHALLVSLANSFLNP